MDWPKRLVDLPVKRGKKSRQAMGRSVLGRGGGRGGVDGGFVCHGDVSIQPASLEVFRY